MSRTKLPSYRLHKPSGQAVITLSGQTYYLGKFGSEASKENRDRLMAEWLSGNKRPLGETGAHTATVKEVLLAYIEFAKGYYVKNGEPSSELGHMKKVLKVVRRLYAETPACEFGPKALKACRQVFLEEGGSRQKINQNIQRIRRVFKWAAEEEMVPGTVIHALQAVTGLRRGRTGAPENAKVLPAPEEDIKAVLPQVSSAVAAMIRLQLLTGMRPGEVVIMRGEDIDRSEAEWVYRPARHKTEHHGHNREVWLGKQAQEVLLPFLQGGKTGYLFSPREAEEARNAKRRLGRKSVMTPSQRARKRKRNRKRAWRDRYDTNSYRIAIQRVLKRLGLPSWSPNQLRHNAATRIEKDFGIEYACAVLGHRSIFTTEIYVEAKRRKAREVMAEVG